MRRDGEAYRAVLRRKPRYVIEEDCIGCRLCEYACPVEVPDEFEGGMGARRAAYIPFTNAIPQTALIDPDDCILCGRCVTACPTDAVVLDQEAETVEVVAQAVVATTGWQLTPLDAKAEYHGGGDHQRARARRRWSGCWRRTARTAACCGRPTARSPSRSPTCSAPARATRPSACPYCSRVCCMYAIKQAMLLSGSLPFADITIYYMDIRAFGKGYEEFYRSAKAMGIEFVKAKVARLTEADDQGVDRARGAHRRVRPGRGAQARPGRALARHAPGGGPRAARRDRDRRGRVRRGAAAQGRALPHGAGGLFVAGTATGPKDIVDTIVEAGAAATEASLYLRERGVTGSAGRRRSPP